MKYHRQRHPIVFQSFLLLYYHFCMWLEADGILISDSHYNLHIH